MSESLWPSDIANVPFKTPASILKEQASALGALTQQVVTGEINSIAQGDGFVHKFLIVAPALGSYRYELFTIYHGAIFYPMNLRWQNSSYSFESEAQFIVMLKQIFAAQGTRNVVQSILAQVEH